MVNCIILIYSIFYNDPAKLEMHDGHAIHVCLRGCFEGKREGEKVCFETEQNEFAGYTRVVGLPVHNAVTMAFGAVGTTHVRLEVVYNCQGFHGLGCLYS